MTHKIVHALWHALRGPCQCTCKLCGAGEHHSDGVNGCFA